MSSVLAANIVAQFDETEELLSSDTERRSLAASWSWSLAFAGETEAAESNELRWVYFGEDCGEPIR